MNMNRHNHEFEKDVSARLKDVNEWINDKDFKPSAELLQDLYGQRKDLHHWESIAKLCNNTNQEFYIGTRTDNRIFGDDHSEVSTSIEMLCCEACCRAYNEYEMYIARMNRGMTGRTPYSPSWGRMSNVQGRVIRKKDKPIKIIHYAGRSMAESLDSDEMRINNEWLD